MRQHKNLQLRTIRTKLSNKQKSQKGPIFTKKGTTNGLSNESSTRTYVSDTAVTSKDSSSCCAVQQVVLSLKGFREYCQERCPLGHVLNRIRVIFFSRMYQTHRDTMLTGYPARKPRRVWVVYPSRKRTGSILNTRTYIAWYHIPGHTKYICMCPCILQIRLYLVRSHIQIRTTKNRNETHTPKLHFSPALPCGPAGSHDRASLRPSPTFLQS